MKQSICFILLFSFFSIINHTLKAQFIWTENIPLSNQLPSNEMTDIWQDKNGFVWIGTTNGLARLDGYQMKLFQNKYHHTQQLTSNHITCIAETDSHIWAGTDHGLNLINKITLNTEECPIKALRTAPIKALCTDTSQNIWIASQGLLYEVNLEKKYQKIYAFTNTQHKRQTRINSIYRDRHQQIWICTPEEIFIKKGLSKNIRKLRLKSNPNTATVMEDKDGNYWLGTWGEGLWQIVRTDNGRMKSIHHPIKKHKISDTEKRFFSLAQDHDGYIWAMAYNGLYRFKPDRHGKPPVTALLPPHIDADKMYTKIITGADGNLWLSSYDGGTLVSFRNDRITEFPIKEMVDELNRTPNLLTLDKDKEGRFWFIQDRLGLCVYSPDASGHRFAKADARDLQATIDARVSAASCFEKNGIWIASPATGHILLFVFEKGRIVRKRTISPPGHGRPAQIIENGDGNLWMRYGTTIILTDRNGHAAAGLPDTCQFSCMAPYDGKQIIAAGKDRLFVLSGENGRLNCSPVTPVIRLTDDESVLMIGADCLGRVTMATNKGRLIGYNIKSRTSRSVEWPDIRKETPINIITRNDRTAVVTNRRIIISEPHSNGTTSFEALEGQASVDIYRDKAACSDPDGTFYAGGKGGFVAYRTGKEPTGKNNRHPIRLSAITDAEGRTPPMVMKGKTPHVILGPDSTALTISLTTAQHDMAAKIRIACRLKGVDQSRVILPRGENTVTYRYLPAGEFILEAQATDRYGRWLPASALLHIVRRPHWYEGTWAMAVYAGMILLVCSAGMIAARKRMEKENRRKLNEALAQARLDYVTGMTHELLTPLNTIACTGEYWERHFPEEQQKTQVLKNNIYRLKQLIQQVLDLRKTDYHKLTAQVTYTNLSAFIRKEAEAHFIPMAAQKDIDLQIVTPADDILGWADEDKLDKMIYNLVANAVKYTPKGKRILISLHTDGVPDRQKAVFIVEDQGPGMKPDETDKVFNRFYTGRHALKGASNGIGLALVRELARIHHGTAGIARNTPGKGAAFFISIPLSASCYAEEEIAQDHPANAEEYAGNETEEDTNARQEKTTDKAKAPVILLTDDNREWVDLAAEIMQDQYRVIKAHDAAEAMDALARHRIDVIIMDVMMPQTDGWTLCRQIKDNIDYSHIPVIMLTACTQETDRIKCYEAGADGYLTKPFDIKVLTARIDNLIAARRKKQKLFRQEEHIHMDEPDEASGDTIFMQSLADCIGNHLDDEHYGLDALAADLHLSKSTLHRKVKTMTGLTPLELMRNIRLKQACRMLARHDRSISEVAYATGFSTPKYFTRCFKEEFGVTPSEFQQDGGIRQNGKNRA